MFTVILFVYFTYRFFFPIFFSFLGLFYIFIFFLLLFLQVLFFTTCERKILALTQRRLGPRVVGDRGRLQFLADALKLITKTFFSPKKANGLFFQNTAIAAFWFSWLSFSNLVFDYGTDVLETEYSVFFNIICSLGFGVSWVIAGWASVSKYAVLGCIRAGLQIISYEMISGAVFLSLFSIMNTANYEILNDIQEYQPFILLIPNCIILLYVGILMETNRPPFDLSEAESDVVSGYTVEYAGILFGLFYLGEYVNLFTTSLALSLSFWGSWWSILTYFGYILNFILVFFFIDGIQMSTITFFKSFCDLADDILYKMGI